MKKFIIPIIFVAAMLGQAPLSSRKQPAPAKSGVDTIIELVQGGASESTVIKSLRSQGTIYKLSPDDLLKLQKAGVSENIINVMTDPKTSVALPAVRPSTPSEITAVKDSSTAGASPTPAPESAAEVRATSYPPDLKEATADIRKSRIVIDSFGYRDAQQQAAYWFNNNSVDVGAGVSNMLSERLNGLPAITILERSKLEALKTEQDRSKSSRFYQGKKTRTGQLWGADYMLVGDVLSFGWDNKSQSNNLGGLTHLIPGNKWGWGAGNLLRKEDKAVVTISFRVVDAETGVDVPGITGTAKGESSRKSKDYSGFLAGPGAGWFNGGGNMTSSAFCKTVIGEATSNAVDKIVDQLKTQLSELPSKHRSIEGRIATVSSNNVVYLALGSNDGVQAGDRFEISQINNEVLDPQTQEVIGVEADKVGELVVNKVDDKVSIGNYGGQPLSQEYVTTRGKGYLARLMSK